MGMNSLASIDSCEQNYLPYFTDDNTASFKKLRCIKVFQMKPKLGFGKRKLCSFTWFCTKEVVKI